MLTRPNDCQILSGVKDVQDTEQTPLRNSLSIQNLLNNPQQNLIPPTAIPIFFKTRSHSSVILKNQKPRFHQFAQFHRSSFANFFPIVRTFAFPIQSVTPAPMSDIIQAEGTVPTGFQLLVPIVECGSTKQNQVSLFWRWVSSVPPLL